MPRPRASQRRASIIKEARYLILDGYVDEPASLGVPPYLAPQVRSLAGGIVAGGAAKEDIQYLTVDQWRDLRNGKRSIKGFHRLEALIIMKGCVVPGKYLRGTPISPREVSEAYSDFDAPIKVTTGAGADPLLLNGTLDPVSWDAGVLGESISSQGNISSRKSTMEEWNFHLLEGAFLSSRHPDHPSPLICEIETTQGCPRYITGGCSFCMEPLKGPMRSREPDAIVEEVRALAGYGVENIRLGGQSDLVTYLSPDIGRSEIPEPDPEPLIHLVRGVSRELLDGRGVKKAIERGSRTGIDTGIIHTDNANPAVIAAYPDRSRSVLEAIIGHCTSGSVMALGLESSDPDVRYQNNLNSTAEDVILAVKIMNETGSKKGRNGLPALLPGINFLGGLKAQTASSFINDLDLLETILRKGWMVRRINIRKVILPHRISEEKKDADSGNMWKGFRFFKREVRKRYDPLFLGKMLPPASVLKGVLTEARSGGTVFGRQIGSYPILVGIPHKIEIGTKVDVAITGISSRSVTGFMTPFRPADASFSDLMAIPGIGKRRAASIFRYPRKDNDVFGEISRSDNGWILEHLKW